MTMNKPDILLLYRYNQWANARILNTAANVTQEQYLAPASFPHGGLRGTLVHTLFAAWIWHQRWTGVSPTQRFKPEEFPTFKSLRVRWEAEEKELMEFLDGLTEERLNRPFSYTNTKGMPFTHVLWHVMVHVVNHSTQHRSEAAAILTDLGHSPGDLDMVYFFDEL